MLFLYMVRVHLQHALQLSHPGGRGMQDKCVLYHLHSSHRCEEYRSVFQYFVNQLPDPSIFKRRTYYVLAIKSHIKYRQRYRVVQ